MKIKKTTLAVLAGMLVTGGAWAATEANSNDGTDGDLGTTSKGDLDISVKVPSYTEGDGSLLIQGLDNLDLGTFKSGADLTAFSNFCIYATGAGDVAFTVAVTIGGGADATGEFKLTGADASNTVDYTVTYLAGLDASADGSPSATAGTKHSFTDLTPVGLNSDFDCSGGGVGNSGNNASVAVNVSTEDASLAKADTYTGKLTLIVSAN